MTLTILVVDDEDNLRDLVRAYLEAEHYTVYLAEDGEQGLQAFYAHQPDIVVLDIMLPGMDGLEVLRHIRQKSAEVYVIMLTAKSDEMDRVLGLRVGADDYLTKPFSPRELAARVNAIARRIRRTDSVEEPSDRRVVVDEARFEVTRDGQSVDLTALEFKLLKTLVEHAGMVLSREQLLQLVWGYDFFGEERVVDVHVGNIRQKLEPDPSNPQFIITVRGVGYKFEDGA